MRRSVALAPVIAWVVFILCIPPAWADADVVVDQSANRKSGWPSDTLLGVPDGVAWDEATADDILLSSAAAVRHVRWWGFYYFDAVPSAESMRIRFYSARPSDGLPGDILYEQDFSNPARTATGVIASVPGFWGTNLAAAEYQFEADLPVSMILDANTVYWLEIVQLGDIDSSFGWRGADYGHGGRAFTSSLDLGWHRSALDMAFQLSTIPEPCTLSLAVVGISLAGRTLKRGRS